MGKRKRDGGRGGGKREGEGKKKKWFLESILGNLGVFLKIQSPLLHNLIKNKRKISSKDLYYYLVLSGNILLVSLCMCFWTELDFDLEERKPWVNLSKIIDIKTLNMVHIFGMFGVIDLSAWSEALKFFRSPGYCHLWYERGHMDTIFYSGANSTPGM